MVRVLSISLLAAATLTACASERDITTYDENDYELTEQDDFLDDYGDYNNLDVGQARTFGTMGPVNDISGLASANGYQDDDYTAVDLVVQNNSGAAMHMLSFTGDLNSLERGEKYTFNADNYDYGRDFDAESGSTSSIFATSTNCSGTGEVGAWDYDTQADEVSLTVTDGEQPGELNVAYETISSDSLFGSDVSGGEFTLQQ